MTTNAPVLQYTNLTNELTLSVDASSKGLGAVIVQENTSIAYGSRASTNAHKIMRKSQRNV